MLSLFSNDAIGRPIFRAVMSQKRFEKLLQCLRFDNHNIRNERRETDGAAAISFIFNKFVLNSQNCFNLGPMACVDEMLVSFRGKCKFRMYMPNKPAKYSIKIMCLNDARNSYFYNGYIYTGKDSDGQTLSKNENKLQKPTQAVIRLAKPLEISNKNITADNWFSSMELLEQLKLRGLTYTDTLKKNKREVPLEFQPSSTRAVGSSLYGFSDNGFTIISHVPNKKKAVLLVSSSHHSIGTDPDNGLPEIVSFYNGTKGGSLPWLEYINIWVKNGWRLVRELFLNLPTTVSTELAANPQGIPYEYWHPSNQSHKPHTAPKKGRCNTTNAGFYLHEALSMIEDDDLEADTITLFPPNNACDDLTDQDSGEEDLVDINNLPAVQMNSEVEFTAKNKNPISAKSDQPGGTVLKFAVYTGTLDDYGGKGHAANIVVHLTEEKLDVGHSLYIDT
ncbi:hypothetical protein NQ318_023532 [Aromia moschata]|uniref:PiggyBac transposable element-derived protein domain-containing protein n=1 Tax=Aromia moschata TaxID=1265417 RepID=A0AAV8YPM9_9CUCU|nr:hypothetical protein NQ318_023532 [Aromia moschata]